MNGHTPEQIYASSWNGASKRTTSPEALDLLLLKQSQPIKVSKNGVRWKELGYGQNCQQLFAYLGKSVYLRVDERDITNVIVFTMEDQFLCVAPANRRLPANASEQQLRDAIRDKKQNRKLVNEYHGKRTSLHDDLPELMIAGAARQHAEDQQQRTPPTPDGPASLRPIHSPLTSNQALKRIAEGLKRPGLRKAVGAEAYSPDSFVLLGEQLAQADAEAKAEAEAMESRTSFASLMSVFRRPEHEE